LTFTPRKTKKHAKVVVMKLSNMALRYINPTGKLFNMVYTNQNGNQYLKEIARQCKINRRPM